MGTVRLGSVRRHDVNVFWQFTFVVLSRERVEALPLGSHVEIHILLTWSSVVFLAVPGYLPPYLARKVSFESHTLYSVIFYSQKSSKIHSHLSLCDSSLEMRRDLGNAPLEMPPWQIIPSLSIFRLRHCFSFCLLACLTSSRKYVSYRS